MQKHSLDQRIVEVQTLSLEEKAEGVMRPCSWDEYIGQEQIKKNLSVFIEASKKRRESLDHILFFGPPGLGKTTISHIIANEMAAAIRVTAAPMIEKSGDLAAIMTNLSEGDILFIDEIHRLTPAIEEILYPAMEDFRLDIVIGSGPAAQVIKVDLPRFTIIGATTRAGMLSNPLRDRFGMSFRMEFYSQDELALIVRKAALRMHRRINDSSAFEIAKRSRGTPRVALRLLRRIRDFSDVKGEVEIGLNTTLYGLEQLGINEFGFDTLDLRYLDLLAKNKGRPIGLSTISATLSEDEGTIEEAVEPYLLVNGYIEKTAKGRVATIKTYEFLKIPPPRLM